MLIKLTLCFEDVAFAFCTVKIASSPGVTKTENFR